MNCKICGKFNEIDDCNICHFCKDEDIKDNLFKTEIIYDREKQNDFILNKKEFLKSYSYLKEKDYKKMLEDLRTCLVILDNCGFIQEYEFDGIIERLNNKLK